MADVILVLNAGSSSIKFSAFEEQGSALELVVHGQVDGLYTAATQGSKPLTVTASTMRRNGATGTELDHRKDSSKSVCS